MNQTTTYYVQNTAIDNLVETYGPRLEKLSVPEKLAVIAVLSRSMYRYHVYGSADGVTAEIRSQDYSPTLDPVLEQHLLAIDAECTQTDALNLMQAIAAQLVPALGKYHGQAS